MTKMDNMTLNVALASGDYGWSEPRTAKRFTLVNASDGKELNLFQVASCFCGTGHCEWEYLLAYYFLTAINKAVGEGKPEADLTNMLNRDLLATRGRVFPQNAVVNPHSEVVRHRERQHIRNAASPSDVKPQMGSEFSPREAASSKEAAFRCNIYFYEIIVEISYAIVVI